MRILLAAITLGGCVSQIQPVPSDWDHVSDPNCTESYAYPVADDLLGGIVAGGGLLIADQTSDRHTAAAIALGGLAIGIVFAIASNIGYGEVHDCRIASEAWRVAGAMTAQDHGDAPGAWFCAADGSCTRERAACEQLGDSCTIVDAAWCFATTNDSKRCFAAPNVCWSKRRRAGDVAASGCRRR